MSDSLVELERRDGIALLRLNRPPLNPLSMALLDELAVQADALSRDEDLKAVVITGNCEP